MSTVTAPGKWSECERYSFAYLRTGCQHKHLTTSTVRHLPLGLPQTNIRITQITNLWPIHPATCIYINLSCEKYYYLSEVYKPVLVC